MRGPNIMLGYLLHDNPGRLVPPKTVLGEGWYDTGDIVTIDDEGYVVIRGRAKRFAKVAGEMVSLAAVEDLVGKAWPEARHAVVSVPDVQRGELLVLLTDQIDADRSKLLQQAKMDGVGEIYVPRQVVITDAVPLMGTGKTDYSEVQNLVKERLEL